jgi:hypothetical protein
LCQYTNLELIARAKERQKESIQLYQSMHQIILMVEKFAARKISADIIPQL